MNSKLKAQITTETADIDAGEALAASLDASQVIESAIRDDRATIEPRLPPKWAGHDAGEIFAKPPKGGPQ